MLGAAVVGFVVGLTGMGGGALMTPMLVFFFGVTPLAAVSSDIVTPLAGRGTRREARAREDVSTRPGPRSWAPAGHLPAVQVVDIVRDAEEA